MKSLAVISYGDQSVTFRAHLLPDTNRVYACKQVSIRRDANQSVEQLERVYHWVRHLVHPNIIRYRQMRKTQTVFLVVMDYWARGSIDDLLKETSQPLTPKRAKTWFAQVLGAVSYLHGKGSNHFVGRCQDYSCFTQAWPTATFDFRAC